MWDAECNEIAFLAISIALAVGIRVQAYIVDRAMSAVAHAYNIIYSYTTLLHPQ
jgi:hypothetical protein